MNEKIIPVPVMFSYEDPKGPWELGYIHPDDYSKVDGGMNVVNIWKRDVEVYQMDDGIPAIPKYIVPLNQFRAPEWRPKWHWDTYCENRKKQ